MVRRFFQGVWTELRVAAAFLRMHFLAASELRISFGLQVVGMMLNNIAFLVIWVLFIQASGPVNGWSTQEILVLQGYSSLVYGIVFVLGAGTRKLPLAVHTGVLDGYLVSPRALALRIATSSSSTSALGDVFFGAIVLGAMLVSMGAGLERVLLLLATIVPAVLLFLSFVLTASLVAFYIPDSEEVANSVQELFVLPMISPGGTLTGPLRTFFILVVPGLTAASIPVEALRDTSWWAVFGVWCVAVAWACIAQLLLTRAVRRYESGNLLGARA